MKRVKKMILVALVFVLVGVGVLSYPAVSDIAYSFNAQKVIDAYRQSIAQKYEQEREGAGTDMPGNQGSEGTLEWLYQEMVAYNENLYVTGQQDLVDPFSYQQIDFDLTQFGFDENMIGYLTIPAIDVNLPVYLGANTDNLAKGAVHLTQTSLPVGGENTNSVIAAHRGFVSAKMFRDIHKLQLDDTVTFSNFRETLSYTVDEIKIISPTDINEVLIQPGRDLLTLITCNPYGHNYERYVVYAERVA